MALIDGASRRLIERRRSSLPVKVTGFEDAKNVWEEETHLEDLTRLGTLLVLAHPVEHGQLIFLEFAMPSHLRSFDFSEKLYGIWAIVRYVQENPQEIGAGRKIGTAFIGKHPPPGFLEEPSKRYELNLRPVGSKGLWNVRELPRRSLY